VIESTVEMTELLGADTNLYLSNGEIQITAVIPTGTTNCKMGDRIKVCLDTRKLHLFDYDTEKTITTE
jgi:multiple sugar transport system ATP-binding protein